jgi:hypothetical protein
VVQDTVQWRSDMIRERNLIGSWNMKISLAVGMIVDIQKDTASFSQQ